ncbi:MAG: DUF1566 domain-containing protein, partial [bacterium]|nr:DUF1566 domain-containing protein [bacterium]
SVSPRFTDNGDGTVTDNLTGLIWTERVDCFPYTQWIGALALANSLADPSCDLTDGSVAGDWRLPNVNELFSLSAFGPGTWALPLGHPFKNVPVDGRLWSSTSDQSNPVYAFTQPLESGESTGGVFKSQAHLVWAVRDPL